MLKNILYSTLCLALSCFYTNMYAQGTDCATAEPFCDNVLNPFPAGVNQPNAPVGNNYDCLFTQPNPAWYTMTVGQGGTLDFTLDNTNNVDIDFIVWGPFASIADATAACGNLGNGGTGGNVADCSYSGAAQEQVVITNAVPGEVYILLITNFSNQPTDIFSSQNVGDGSVVCDCDVNSTYSMLPFGGGLNDGVLIDTNDVDAVFAVCGPDPVLGGSSILGFNIGAGGQNPTDTISFFGTDVSTVFATNTVFSLPPTAPFDTNDVIIQVTPDIDNIGINEFTVSILNQSPNEACIQSYPITVLVPGVSIEADTILCPMSADTVQLTAIPATDTFLTSSETYAWSQIAGVTVGFSDVNAQNPEIYIPSTIMDTDSIVLVVTYNANIDPANGTICSSTDTITLRANGASMTTMPGSVICVGDDALLQADFQTVRSGSNGICGTNTSACANTPSIVQIGNGTNPIPTGFVDNTPYQGFFEDGRMQMLFLASELNAAGIQPGLITSLAFDVVQANSTAPYSGFTIRMGCTNLTTLNNFVTLNSTAFTGVVTPTLGWNTHNFTTPYEWDGFSNLIVEVCFDNNAFTLSDPVNYTNTGFQSVIYDLADFDTGCSLNAYPTLENNRPNVRFGNCTLELPIDYLWSPTAGILSGEEVLDSLTASPAQTTTYTVTATDGFCTLTDTVTITVQSSLPAPTINCDSVTSNSITFAWDTITGAVSYEYSTDGGVTWIATTDTFALVAGLATGTTVDILVRGITNTGTCLIGLQDTASCTTTLNCAFTYTIDAFDNTNCDTTQPNGFLVVNVTSGVAPFEFELNGQAVTINTNSDTIFTGLGNSSGVVVGTETSTGCQDNVAFTIGDDVVAPVVTIQQTGFIPCTGEAIAVLEATAPNASNPTYDWNNGAVGASISGLSAGTYTVSMTDGICSSTADFTVAAPLNPSLDAYIEAVSQDSTAIFLGETVTIDAGFNETGVTYSWAVSPSTDIAAPSVSGTTSTPDAEGFYIYEITATADSCITIDTVVLTVNPTDFLGMPNAFTPNADMNNDVFGPVELVGAEVFTFKIYNRFGDLVFDNPNYASNGEGWDGRFQNKDQPRDVYMYILEYQLPSDTEVQQVRGEVLLIR